MLFNEFKKIVIDRAVEKGIKDYEIYYSSSESVSVDTFKDQVRQFDSSVAGGICFRCIVNERMGYASTEELSEYEAVALVDRAYENALCIESTEKELLASAGKKYAKIEKKETTAPSVNGMIEKALDGQKHLYAADKMVIDGCSTNVIYMKETVSIANSKGIDLTDESSASGIVSVAVISDGKEMNDKYEIKIGDLEKINIKEQSELAVAKAKEMMGADVAPTGNYDVVFSPDAFASLLLTFSSAFSSDSVRKGLSKLGGKEGSKIASDIFTLVDDPMNKESISPRTFDDEGSPTFKKSIIENGILKTLLYDLKNANIFGKETTGNGLKHSHASSVSIRPFTLCVGQGKESREKIFEDVSNGVFVTDLSGLHAGANVISGDFSLQSEGFMIENGKKGRPVKSFTIAGNYYDLLNNIVQIGSDVETVGVNSRVLTPSIRVKELSVAGK